MRLFKPFPPSPFIGFEVYIHEPYFFCAECPRLDVAWVLERNFVSTGDDKSSWGNLCIEFGPPAIFTEQEEEMLTKVKLLLLENPFAWAAAASFTWWRDGRGHRFHEPNLYNYHNYANIRWANLAWFYFVQLSAEPICLLAFLQLNLNLIIWFNFLSFLDSSRPSQEHSMPRWITHVHLKTLNFNIFK